MIFWAHDYLMEDRGICDWQKGAAVNAAELKNRTFEFATRIVRLVRALPKTVEARAVGAQLVRCGTAVGANYRASCKSRSRAEFVAKIGIVEEETDEAAYWLELIISTGMLKSSQVQQLLDEAYELSRIFAKSRITAKSGAQLAVGNRK
jgi:four helix bundle protein